MEKINWRQVFFILAFVILAAALISILMGLSLWVVPVGRFTSEISLTILLVSGLIGLVTLLVLAVVVYRVLGLSDKTRAFGLPEGTIRATLAIGLVIIFSMVSIFLFSQTQKQNVSQIESITQEQLAAIPAQRIVSSSPNEKDSSKFDVLITQENQAANDIAKTLLTTVGTLAVAVAGFYFGTQSVPAVPEAVVSPKPIVRSTARGSAANPQTEDQANPQTEDQVNPETDN